MTCCLFDTWNAVIGWESGFHCYLDFVFFGRDEVIDCGVIVLASHNGNPGSRLLHRLVLVKGFFTINMRGQVCGIGHWKLEYIYSVKYSAI